MIHGYKTDGEFNSHGCDDNHSQSCVTLKHVMFKSVSILWLWGIIDLIILLKKNVESSFMIQECDFASSTLLLIIGLANKWCVLNRGVSFAFPRDCFYYHGSVHTLWGDTTRGLFLLLLLLLLFLSLKIR